MGWVAQLAVVAAVLAALPLALEQLFARTFPVHSSGAIFLTGVSTGIGRHAAVELAKSGFRVYGTVRKAVDAAAIRALGVENLEPIICDVTDSAAIADAVATVAAALKGERLVAVVNNAGISKDLPFEIQPLTSVRQVFDVNYFGVLDVTQQFLPLLRAAGPGARIVNIGSLAGWISMPGTVAYSGTKHALEAFSDALRLELLPAEISVSLIKPAYVATEIGTKATAAINADEAKAADSEGHYSDFLEAETARLAKVFKLAPGPEVTTKGIVHAVTSPQPRTRYFMGTAGSLPGWYVARLKWLLPDRAWDLVLLYADAIDALLGV